VMSLVEGHAEYVMDGVGPDVVPSVRTLRKRFAQRRKGRGPLDRVLRRLLGLEQKMKQYADGRTFVGGVVDLVGMEGFNQVWSGPEALPRIEELTEPARWVERVHGRPAIPA
jgi:putative hydrolase